MSQNRESTASTSESLGSRLGLSDRTLALLNSVFCSRPQITRAIVYGSRANGNYRPSSDIDIVLDAPTFGLTELFKVETELDDLMLPYKIDLSLLHHIDNAALLGAWAAEGTSAAN